VVRHIVEKMVKNRFGWFMLVERKHLEYVVNIVDQMKDNQITKGRARLRKTIMKDLEINELNQNIWFII
jgi:hypothetical protein